MPSPSTKRKNASTGIEVASPEPTEHNEYVSMLRISARVRPMRSAIKPNRTPPIPEASKVKVPSQPATDLLMPNAVITCAMTRLYSMTSKASSAQPSAAAMSVRFCADVTSERRNVVAAIGGLHFSSVREETYAETQRCAADLITGQSGNWNLSVTWWQA